MEQVSAHRWRPVLKKEVEISFRQCGAEKKGKYGSSILKKQTCTGNAEFGVGGVPLIRERVH